MMLLSLFFAPALAWQTADQGWSQPIRWCATSDARAVALDAWSVWQSVSGCVPLAIEEVEDCALADIYFVDVAGDVVETCQPNVPCTIETGSTVCPDDAASVDTVQRLGFALGLRHPCEEGEACDAVEQAALMRWDNPGGCAPSVPTVDDFEGLSHLYGSGAVYRELDNVLVASVGEEVCLSPVLTGDLDAAFSWRLGDGATGEGQTVCHTYTDELSTWISLSYTYPSSCGDWSREHEQWGLIQAGNPIAPVDSEASATSGCATGPVGAGGLLLGLLGLVGRRRR